jgi:hypothetical protein
MCGLFESGIESMQNVIVIDEGDLWGEKSIDIMWSDLDLLWYYLREK